MLVLGRTADDKGTQLEALVRAILERQSYKRVRTNLVAAGGNELDVVAERESQLVGTVQITPVMCEAKAYADPVTMPAWQRFLGKLMLERVHNAGAVGVLIALNGINGNVAGSYKDLRRHDTAVFVFEGSDLAAEAELSGQLATEVTASELVASRFHKVPLRIEPTYYEGGFYWVIFWQGDEYSVVDGQGNMLSVASVDSLRVALEYSVSGTLLAADEARAAAEARHATRLRLMNKLFRGEALTIDGDSGDDGEVLAALEQELFCRVVDGCLVLLPPSDLEAQAVSRLFLSFFDDVVRVSLFSFMAENHHVPYVHRLIEVLPEIQGGFTVEGQELDTLQAWAPLFPSVWATLARENPMITTHRAHQPEAADEATLASDRTSFWEAVTRAIRADYANNILGGFLYDHMGVAEIEERVDFIVKSKDGPVGHAIRTSMRNAVRQYADDEMARTEPIYVMVRMLPTVAEPWDDSHPEPEFPLLGEG